MTDTEIRVVIAKCCGWDRPDDCARTPAHQWRNPNDGCCYDEPPDYPNDLNAMHEAEKDQIYTYNRRYDIEPKEQASRRVGFETILCNLVDDPIHATARQRSEAFLRALGKWKESVQSKEAVLP